MDVTVEVGWCQLMHSQCVGCCCLVDLLAVFSVVVESTAVWFVAVVFVSVAQAVALGMDWLFLRLILCELWSEMARKNADLPLTLVQYLVYIWHHTSYPVAGMHTLIN